MFLSRFTYVLSALLVAGFAVAAFADPLGFKETFSRLDTKRWYVSDGWANGDHQSCEWRAGALAVAGNNMRMTVSDHAGKTRAYSCPEIHTNARLSYGLYETRMRSAAGSGLNTAFFTYIGPPNGVPDWDEIDFEFLGKDPHTVNINHYTKGKPYDGKVVQLGFDASQSFHNYAFDWEADKITWFVDGKKVAETAPGSPIGNNPGMLFLSLWTGSQGEDAWMGHFDYKAPSTADVEWAAYTPTNAPCAFPESLRCK